MKKLENKIWEIAEMGPKDYFRSGGCDSLTDTLGKLAWN